MKNLLDEKDSYNNYRDSTIGSEELPSFFPPDSTTIPKSKYDNIVGQIKLKNKKQRMSNDIDRT